MRNAQFLHTRSIAESGHAGVDELVPPLGAYAHSIGSMRGDWRSQSLIQRILPPFAVSVEARDEIPGAELAAETNLIGGAFQKRHDEFVAARRCARLALAALGEKPGPILAGVGREPIWPPGICGSITHCMGYCAAAVSRSCHTASLGIDAEQHRPLPSGTLDLIANADERRAIANLLKRHPSVHWDLLMFCAKEAVYKAWYPMTRRWLDFLDVRVDLLQARGEFTVQLLGENPCEPVLPRLDMSGRYRVVDGLALTVAFTV